MVTGHKVFQQFKPEIRPAKRMRFSSNASVREATQDDTSWDVRSGHEPVYQDATDGVWTSCLMMMNHIPRPVKWLAALRLLEVASQVYDNIPMATVPSRVIEQPLVRSKWQPSAISEVLEREAHPALRGGSAWNHFKTLACSSVETLTRSMTRPQIFSCIAMFESGQFNIEPDTLAEVIALCSEDSIFVAGILLESPGADPSERPLQYMVGNIGHSGMAFLVSPLSPRIRKETDNADGIDHKIYDYRDLDAFGGTSMHLSFTDWKMPLEWENTGEIDQEIFLLESVVSVHDNGRWIADIDVLSIERDQPDAIEFPCDCPLDQKVDSLDITSIDSWDELLDLPPCVSVIRAKNNWVARLSAACIIAQKGNSHALCIVGGERLCWTCLLECYTVARSPQVLIY